MGKNVRKGQGNGTLGKRKLRTTRLESISKLRKVSVCISVVKVFCFVFNCFHIQHQMSDI